MKYPLVFGLMLVCPSQLLSLSSVPLQLSPQTRSKRVAAKSVGWLQQCGAHRHLLGRLPPLPSPRIYRASIALVFLLEKWPSAHRYPCHAAPLPKLHATSCASLAPFVYLLVRTPRKSAQRDSPRLARRSQVSSVLSSKNYLRFV